MAKILIAEDDASMRHVLTMALSRAGHEVDLYEAVPEPRTWALWLAGICWMVRRSR